MTEDQEVNKSVPEVDKSNDAPKAKDAPKAVIVNDDTADTVASTSCCCRRCDVKQPPRGKLHCYDYFGDIPGGYADSEFVEVQFKNTRKGFYKNSLGIPLEIGDWVAVEAAPGHDVGQVTLVGALVKLQMKRANIKNQDDVKRVFRRARQTDLDKFEEAKAKENDTMIRSRKIAESLKLNMKIGDVEYQGDGNKAIFYYISDERVDFRQLIKVLAETFKVRIEMKQIGARQEAGRIGGIGPCGRPLCCSSWMSNFVSVATSAARYQDISLNPQKLAGQCAKLKCCLNFEVDTYVESAKRLPAKDIRLETADATYFHFKADIFKREITYSTDKSIAANLVTIDAERAFEVIAMNKQGEKPLKLQRDGEEKTAEQKYNDILDPDNLNRFDGKKRKKRKGPKGQRPQDGGAEKRSQEGAEKRSHDGAEKRPANQGDGARQRREGDNHNRGERRENRREKNDRQGGQRRDRQQSQRPQQGQRRQEGRQVSPDKPQNQAPATGNNTAKPDNQ